eukprot:COSAG03_NODE_17501_length_374_cov_0.752727_1_plen_31_part_01
MGFLERVFPSARLSLVTVPYTAFDATGEGAT